MSSAKVYGIYIARFPFLDSNNDKIRPVIAISKPYGQHNIITIIPISSTAKQEAVDTNLNDWKKEGLIKPSVARVHRLTTMLQSDLLTELGSLTMSDIKKLKSLLRTFLDL